MIFLTQQRCSHLKAACQKPYYPPISSQTTDTFSLRHPTQRTHATSFAQSKKRDGFALILSMVMMGLLLITLLYFMVLAHVYLVKNERPQNESLARENARLGLTVALGELQKYVSTDQSTTSLPIVKAGAPLHNPHFTYAWSTSNASKPPAVLVSGNEHWDLRKLEKHPENYITAATEIPSPNTNSDSIWMHKPVDEMPNGIAVVRQPTSQDANDGNYAFWISDHGLQSSPFSQFTQVDPINGGMRTTVKLETLDTQPSNEEHTLWNSETRDFLTSKPHPEKGIPMRSPNKKSPTQFSIRPILTELMLNCAYGRDTDTGDLYLYYRLEFELWNPYNHAIRFDTTNHDLLFKISGIPSFTVENETRSKKLELTPPPIEFDYNRFIPLPAGMVEKIEYPASLAQYPSGVQKIKIGNLKGAEKDHYTLSFDASDLRIQLLNTSTSAQEPQILLDYRIKGLEPFSMQYTGETVGRTLSKTADAPADRFGGMTRKNLETSRNTFAYHLSIKDNPEEIEDWLGKRTIFRNAFETDITVQTNDTPYNLNKIALEYDYKNAFSLLDLFAAEDKTKKLSARKAIVFTLPNGTFKSLSELSLLRLQKFPHATLGAPNLGSLNSIFDQFQFPVPEIHNGLMPQGLNINSTSARAWASLLKTNLQPREKENAHYAITTLPFQAASLQEKPAASKTLLTPWADDREHPAWESHVRHLDENDIDTKTPGSVSLSQNIARIIQEHHRNKGRPFRSLEEFLNAGVLEKSIRKTPSFDLDSKTKSGAPKGSPMHLSQTRLLHTLAPKIFARSDTFTIRSYGDASTEGLESTQTSAYCEALIQRMPTGQGTLNNRTFKIISIRWLDPHEI